MNRSLFIAWRSVGSLLLLACSLGSLSVLAATPPYPQSRIITAMDWDFTNLIPMRKAIGSDLWPLTWASDGNLYGAWGDGGGFGGTNSLGRVSLGFARITGMPAGGDPDSYQGENLWGDAPQFALSQATFGGKVDDLISVGGVLYGQGGLWTAANCGCSNPVAKGSDNPTQRTITWSRDLGRSWQIAPWSSVTDEGTSLQFGPDYSGAADPAHVYLYYQTDLNRNAGSIYLRRVPSNELAADPSTPGHYEYFAGSDARGTPLWSQLATRAVAVFTDPSVAPGTSASQTVAYDAALGRYVLTAAHGTSVGQIGFFESLEPWGPWSTIAYYDNWGAFNSSGGEGNGLNFPTKWMSADGRTLWGVFSAGGSFDSFNLVRVTLTASNAIPQILAPAPGTTLMPGETVTALGSGPELSWSVDRLNDGNGAIAQGAGGAITFEVPSNSLPGQLIRITLAGADGRVYRDYPLAPSALDGIAGGWHFDAGTGTLAADSSGNGNTGALVNGPKWVAGRIGQALSFSGTRDYVQVRGYGSLANLYRTGLTLAAWIKPSSSGGDGAGRILDKHNAERGWYWKLSGSTSLEFIVAQFSGRALYRACSNRIRLDVWQHVAITWDGSTHGAGAHCYIDGLPADGWSVDGAGTALDDTAVPLAIGNRSADLARGFAGVIDEVYVFDRVLRASEVRSLAGGGT
ncbi:MAG TPA: LamG-like jellyroll fold domain-containing protein [Steroidobacteraceae bacterium]|nr:LamG-like jellyroll fold domain-containing protein [Steroidobacteraceae bacterium]